VGKAKDSPLKEAKTSHPVSSMDRGADSAVRLCQNGMIHQQQELLETLQSISATIRSVHNFRRVTNLCRCGPRRDHERPCKRCQLMAKGSKRMPTKSNAVQ